MKTSDRGLFSKQKKPFFSSGKARFYSRKEMQSIAQKYLPNPTASCLSLSEELSSDFQSSTPLSSAYIYNVRAGGRRAGGKPATAVPTRFVLEKKSACLAPEYVFGKAQRAFTSTSEMFCERQKNCFWHSSRLKKKGEKRLAVVFISLFRGYAAILAPHRKTCGVWRGRTVGGSGGLQVL